MRVFGKRNDGVTGRRAAARQPMLLPAAVTSFARVHLAELLNLSPIGANLRGADLPPPGACVLVKARAVEAFGTVVWNCGGLCGVQFEAPLTGLQVSNLRHESELAVIARRSAPKRIPPSDWVSNSPR